MRKQMKKAPFIGISRHRLGIDGEGVTTLVGFHGCPLQCRYCINDICHDPKGIIHELTPEELYDKVKIDNLYFLATNGGLTFGGGEPLLHSDFIKEVEELGAKEWSTTIETSLYVDQKHIDTVMPYVSDFIVDVKDMNPEHYQLYTDRPINRLIDNLQYLVSQGKADKVLIRVPLIPGLNTAEGQQKSVDQLKAMGFTRFDVFRYRVNEVLDFSISK